MEDALGRHGDQFGAGVGGDQADRDAVGHEVADPRIAAGGRSSCQDGAIVRFACRLVVTPMGA
ncbi:hypothetical protein [Nonomuraea sediminis]|uniref:hypothetical protein n=1 Tax=Nonomuraea sediminis TaxID=2835864 RepID=UPI001BDBFA72|nr:hypothetical protein [Nonomuraea sediminis]